MQVAEAVALGGLMARKAVVAGVRFELVIRRRGLALTRAPKVERSPKTGRNSAFTLSQTMRGLQATLF